MSTLTMGIDLAAKAEKTAVCLLRWEGREPTLVMLRRGKADDSTPFCDKWLSTTAYGVRGDYGGTITKVGIDDPFGWPIDFLDAMASYRDAPNWPTALDDPRKKFCFRETDRFVRNLTGKQPLSVSANLIAIPAMRCATLLSDIARHKGNESVSRDGSGLCCEVYPDPALRHWTADSPAWADGKSYKGAANGAKRVQLLESLLSALPIGDPLGALEKVSLQDDYLDALVCALVARAAELDQTIRPQDEKQVESAAIEGWIHLPSGQLSDLCAP
jgi:hypothetical protein